MAAPNSKGGRLMNTKTDKTEQRTSTPWNSFSIGSTENWWGIKGSINEDVAQLTGCPCHKSAQANAAFIVRAVNAHEDLLRVLYQCKTFLDDMTREENLERPRAYVVDFAKQLGVTQAIAKAEAK